MLSIPLHYLAQVARGCVPPLGSTLLKAKKKKKKKKKISKFKCQMPNLVLIETKRLQCSLASFFQWSRIDELTVR